MPGHLGGGPVRALVNLIDHLHTTHEFFIFTRNHDYLDHRDYSQIEPNVWQHQTRASVYYTKSQEASRSLLEQIKCVQPDWIYLNGALPPLTRMLLRLRQTDAEVRQVPILLAPHGNLSGSTLAHHRLRKQVWLLFARWRKLYSEVIWHAASVRETEQIRMVFGQQAQIREIPMAPSFAESEPLLAAAEVSPLGSKSESSSRASTFRLVYFGRLSPEKNLPFAFQLLAKFARQHPQQQICYDLIGSGCDAYLQELQKLATQLPTNVQIHFVGQLSPDALALRLRGGFTHSAPPYHALLMPSLTENFSYTVLESLQAGIPVLISDQTPWHELAERGLGWDLKLHDLNTWLSALEFLQAESEVERIDRRQRCRLFAVDWIASYASQACKLFAL
ncbi:glycosyltransferase [Coraliomargarita algicola]|uniref:Glycosyltransferase n=1 Tax=Coraliomargarita algicola TaxID=3092156 RepID=A0ABZ0RJ78_9BACT|nr:glycosyltransferase [Coraliomargarita sp. J2-16]WPJ94987.1 glycosyltransferase [Coraliomargarita sp. J2-16]